MPELPEVETIANGLNQVLPGEIIKNVEIFYSGCIKGDLGSFQESVKNRQIQGVRRRGKLLILDLDRDKHIVCHLKMTGQLLWEDKGKGENFSDKYTQLVFNLAGNNRLFFQDKRKFGYLGFFSSDELQQWDFIANLGPDALEITEQDLKNLIGHKKMKLKSFLMDQKMIAGIGNIYADEALFKAGLHPCLRACDLDSDQVAKLKQSLHTVLNKAIDAKGSSFSDYVDSSGNSGSFQEQFCVYGCKGGKCKHCGTDLETIKVSSRSSVYCPCCQPLTDDR